MAMGAITAMVAGIVMAAIIGMAGTGTITTARTGANDYYRR